MGFRPRLETLNYEMLGEYRAEYVGFRTRNVGRYAGMWGSGLENTAEAISGNKYANYAG